MQVRIVARAVVALVALTAVGHAQTRSVPPLPSASKISTAAEAARVLRQLYFANDYNDGATLGDTLVRRFPRDSKVRAWHVANLGGAHLGTTADSLTAKTDTLSRDPWALAARSFARAYSLAPSKFAGAEATRLARRARSLAPRDADLAWLVAHSLYATGPYIGNSGDVIAYVDSVAPRFGNPVELQVLRADALYSSAYPPFDPSSANQGPDTEKRAAALRAFAAARSADSTNFQSAYDLAARLRGADDVESLRLARLAVALSPRAPYARTLYWMQLTGQRGVQQADKQMTINADRGEFLALTDSAPWAMAAVIQSMRSPSGREPEASVLEDRILAKAPRSPQAEDVMLSRANQWRDSLYVARDSTRQGPKSDSAVARRRFLDATWAFIEKPWVANPATRDQAVSGLFFEVREDTTFPADKLRGLARRVIAATSGGAPSFRYGEVARALARRKLDLDYAAQLAREGMKHTAAYLDDFPGYRFTSLGDKADALDGSNASLYENLGVVYHAQGKLADADRELTHALELTKKNAMIYYDLGQVKAAEGKDEEAELMYAQGMTIRVRGVNPNRQELQRLYQKREGSVDGWEKYITSLEEKERATRKAKILNARVTDGRTAPPFSLADLGGRTVHSDSLKSHYVVVNFWGTWCGPCVAEMPELQQFYDRYRGDKSVTILTISNDKDLGELRDWMAKRKLTIPTLFDDGYVGMTAQIHAFPTTWFIDRDGKLQFSAIGNTGALVEEWSWRLEAMRTGVATQP
jgi:thiol-disulfide isomerase/thioredoxin/tetratricopeptide (TPR) repeat protein